MGDSSSSVSVDIEIIPWGGKEEVVQTSYGSMSVFVCRDQGKPALITYPDVALNYMSCFQGLFFCLEASSLLFHNFCVYHIDAPGHEYLAAGSCSYFIKSSGAYSGRSGRAGFIRSFVWV